MKQPNYQATIKRCWSWPESCDITVYHDSYSITRACIILLVIMYLSSFSSFIKACVSFSWELPTTWILIELISQNMWHKILSISLWIALPVTETTWW